MVTEESVPCSRPPRLRAGDRLAAVTPPWGGPASHPDRYRVGKRQLEETFDVEVVEMPHTLADPDRLHEHPELRADDLHRAFTDPDIAGLVTTIGGDDAMRLLPHLDLELIAANPKVFLGYSDATAIHMALRRAGIFSFYGPAVMSGFGENAGLHDYLVEGIRRTLFQPEVPLVWPPNYEGWTTQFTDWDDPEAQRTPRELRASTGWRWHGGTRARGMTLAACVEVLDPLRGSTWWPETNGTVLLLQTSEEVLPPLEVTRFLRSLALTGELHDVAGIVLGRPGGSELSDDDRLAYDEAVLEVVRDEEGLAHAPVVTNADFGHTDPMWTVPQGVPVELDPEGQRITFLTSGVI